MVDPGGMEWNRFIGRVPALHPVARMDGCRLPDPFDLRLKARSAEITAEQYEVGLRQQSSNRTETYWHGISGQFWSYLLKLQLFARYY